MCKCMCVCVRYNTAVSCHDIFVRHFYKFVLRCTVVVIRLSEFILFLDNRLTKVMWAGADNHCSGLSLAQRKSSTS